EIIDVTFSGQIAQLAFFPPLFQSIALFLPFQYMTYIPTQIFLEKLSTPLIVEHLLRLFLWIMVLVGIELSLWKRGLKQYDGAGI
ncbi:MAG: ABC-2 family transporter protein, partial [Patescibacteria group bacterium]